MGRTNGTECAKFFRTDRQWPQLDKTVLTNDSIPTEKPSHPVSHPGNEVQFTEPKGVSNPHEEGSPAHARRRLDKSLLLAMLTEVVAPVELIDRTPPLPPAPGSTESSQPKK